MTSTKVRKMSFKPPSNGWVIGHLAQTPYFTDIETEAKVYVVKLTRFINNLY